MHTLPPATVADAPPLDFLLDYWLPALGMSDWTVRASYSRTAGKYGRTTVWWDCREARIEVLDPAMVTIDWPPFDPELVLMHELVHCIVEPLVPADANKTILELVVEQLAKSFVRMHRVWPVEDDWLHKRRTAL